MCVFRISKLPVNYMQPLRAFLVVGLMFFHYLLNRDEQSNPDINEAQGLWTVIPAVLWASHIPHRLHTAVNVSHTFALVLIDNWPHRAADIMCWLLHGPTTLGSSLDSLWCGHCSAHLTPALRDCSSRWGLLAVWGSAPQWPQPSASLTPPPHVPPSTYRDAMRCLSCKYCLHLGS